MQLHYSKLQYSMLLFLGLRARFQLTAKLMSTWWLIIAKKIITQYEPSATRTKRTKTYRIPGKEKGQPIIVHVAC